MTRAMPAIHEKSLTPTRLSQSKAGFGLTGCRWLRRRHHDRFGFGRFFGRFGFGDRLGRHHRRFWWDFPDDLIVFGWRCRCGLYCRRFNNGHRGWYRDRRGPRHLHRFDRLGNDIRHRFSHLVFGRWWLDFGIRRTPRLHQFPRPAFRAACSRPRGPGRASHSCAHSRGRRSR